MLEQYIEAFEAVYGERPGVSVRASFLWMTEEYQLRAIRYLQEEAPAHLERMERFRRR